MRFIRYATFILASTFVTLLAFLALSEGVEFVIQMLITPEGLFTLVSELVLVWRTLLEGIIALALGLALPWHLTRWVARRNGRTERASATVAALVAGACAPWVLALSAAIQFRRFDVELVTGFGLALMVPSIVVAALVARIVYCRAMGRAA